MASISLANLLLEFYEDYSEVDLDEGRNYPDKRQQRQALDDIVNEYVERIYKNE